MNSVKMSNRILRLSPPSGCHTILVFAHQTLWRYSDGDPLKVKRALNASGVGENHDSKRISGYWIDDYSSVIISCQLSVQ